MILYIRTPFLLVEQHSLLDNVREMETMMMGVGVSDETVLRSFMKEHALLAIQYVTSTLFQHYRLFQLLFTVEQEDEYFSTKVRSS